MREFSRIRRFRMIIGAQTVLIAVLAITILMFAHFSRTISITFVPPSAPAQVKLLPGASTVPTIDTRLTPVLSLKTQAFPRQI